MQLDNREIYGTIVTKLNWYNDKIRETVVYSEYDLFSFFDLFYITKSPIFMRFYSIGFSIGFHYSIPFHRFYFFHFSPLFFFLILSFDFFFLISRISFPFLTSINKFPLNFRYTHNH